MKRYAMVNLGNGEKDICMSFENKKELVAFCESYSYYTISYKEANKYEVKHVRSFGEGFNRCWEW